MTKFWLMWSGEGSPPQGSYPSTFFIKSRIGASSGNNSKYKLKLTPSGKTVAPRGELFPVLTTFFDKAWIPFAQMGWLLLTALTACPTVQNRNLELLIVTYFAVVAGLSITSKCAKPLSAFQQPALCEGPGAPGCSAAFYRAVFLDDTPTVAYTLGQLQEFRRKVEIQGVALAIGHPYPSTCAALARFLPELERDDIQLVTAPALVQLPEIARLWPPRHPQL